MFTTFLTFRDNFEGCYKAYLIRIIMFTSDPNYYKVNQRTIYYWMLLMGNDFIKQHVPQQGAIIVIMKLLQELLVDLLLCVAILCGVTDVQE